MSLHPRAGMPAQASDLVNVPRLVSNYYVREPSEETMVSFGTSGHRGSSFNGAFTEVHIAAICQALVEYRELEGISGPMFIGMDTHGLSECAFITAVEVLVANGVEVRVQEGRSTPQTPTYTPTPVISHAILAYNSERTSDLADGIVITPSHNPPEDGGFKYNPPNGGPADGSITAKVQQRANEIIRADSSAVQVLPFAQAWASELLQEYDYIQAYVDDLANVIDMQAIADAGVKIGVDPLGGSGIAFWDVIASTYGLDIEVVNTAIDPTFSFMTLDKDGKIRMDCSSPYAMASLIALKDRFDVAVANDPDYDRHGIVTRSSGLMNPNHYLAVAIQYLYTHRPEWSESLAIGKTLVSSSMVDRVAKSLGRTLTEVPVGFKWFVDGLVSSSLGFGGEESAGASFLRRDGKVWTTDKDGFILALLAAEITAVTGKDPGEHYQALTETYAAPVYTRIDAPATSAQKAVLAKLNADDVSATELAGEPIIAKLTEAPGNGAAIGGLKVVTENGWFAARPSGTEEIYKIYAESFKGQAHLELLIAEAKQITSATFEAAGV